MSLNMLPISLCLGFYIFMMIITYFMRVVSINFRETAQALKMLALQT